MEYNHLYHIGEIMSIIGELLQALSDLFYPKERRRHYDEAKTVPLTAKLLAQALSGEGRKHAAVGFSISEKIENNSGSVSLFTLMGGSDGQNVLPDFGIFGVSEGFGALTLAGQASNESLRAFSSSIIEDAILELLAFENEDDTSPFHQAITDAFQDAVHIVSREIPQTTFSMTAGLLFADMLILGQLGNSPAFIVDHHHVERITGVQGGTFGNRDEDGSNGQAASRTARGGLSQDFANEFAVYSRPVPRDGYVLVCTHGLPDAVPDYDIQRIVLELQDPQAICDGLIKEAHSRNDKVEQCAITLHFPPDFGVWR
jgi:serine/threonine protein phosphatase PrpC